MPTTILIVDDTLAGRETLRALLTSSDYQLEFANDGPQALFQAARLNPDLILLDVMMPGMDGFEVCRRLRADRSLAEVPIIMVTALDDRESRLHGIEAGADDFISKPFDRAELRARVRTITRLNRYRQLVTERTQFEWVVDQADDGYVIVNDDDDVLYANARARWLLSGSTDPLGGTFIALAQQHYHCEPDVVWAGWPAQAEIELVRERYLVRPESPGAHAVWLAVTILNLPAGPQSRRLIRLRDVTAQMTTQREIWSFHALIAHKLRTPLLSISIGIEMLTMPGARLSPADIADAAYSAASNVCVTSSTTSSATSRRRPSPPTMAASPSPSCRT
jgi:CheY-like chemotaxis protein